MFTIPATGPGRLSTLTLPVQLPAPAGNVLTAAEQITEQHYQTELAAYNAEEGVRFDQATFDMQFNAVFADHKKRKAVGVEMDTELLLHQEAISVQDQILLDTGSTMDLFCNSRLLSGTPYLADKPIQMLTNAGTKVHWY